jgi:excinuclease ABC subunit C
MIMIKPDLQHIAESVERFPQNPGIYIMKDSADVPIYIGKAVNLKSRVMSYFSDSHVDRPYIPVMLERLHHIEWIATQTESEALITEANLIRKYKPRFNIDLKDDKHYPYLKITVKEHFPRLLVVRRIEQDGSLYFGPYTDMRAMHNIVNYAKKIFRIRDCNKILPLKKTARPCVNYSIGRCNGPCAGHISENDYGENIDMLIRFLKGRRKELLLELKQRMEIASDTLRFEEASVIRDRIRLVQDASNLQRADLADLDMDCDVVGVYKGDRSLCMAILHFREGLLMSVRQFIISLQTWQIDESNVETALVQYYRKSNTEPPAELFLPEIEGLETELMEQAILRQFNKTTSVKIPVKGVRRALVEMAIKNARLYLMQKLPVNNMDDLQELQNLLHLPKFPRVIEAFDISNIGGAFSVAGMVQFRGGIPDKSNYRRYKIKTIEGQDDFAMLMEAVTRRLERRLKEGKPFADCLLIDGGKGQLHSVMEALRGFTDPPTVFSLAKKEELLFSPYCDDPITLDSTHPVRKLAERIRDEVHRFAIAYHRNIRGRQFKTTLLDSIPGIGPKKALVLLRAFGSVSGIRAATDKDIAKLEGFSLNAARSLHEKLGEK